MDPSSAPAAIRTIVLAEDDAALAEALQFALELEGFEVRAYETAEALLERPLPSADTCLVLDQRLPGITGIAALTRLRRRGVELPAIIMTSDPSAAVRTMARQVHAAVVEKPLLGDALLAQIRAAFGD
jgi:FixJ family two-component response regulator